MLVAGLLVLILPRGDVGHDGGAASTVATLDDAGSASVLDAGGAAETIEGAGTAPPPERTTDGTRRSARVTDESGRPLAGVRVDWRAPEELPRGWQTAWTRNASEASQSLGHAYTDASGLYAAIGLGNDAVSSEHVFASFALPGYHTRVVRFDASVEATAWVADVSLERAPELVVRVLATDGSPAAGAQILVEGVDDPRSMSRGSDEAVELAGGRAFAAMLVDINLGEERTGVDLLRQLRGQEATRRTPAIACTAHSMPEDEEHFYEAGFDGYLAKPYRKAGLIGVLREAIAAGTRG